MEAKEEGEGRRKPNTEAMWMRGERGWRKDGVSESVRASGFVFPPKQKLRKHGKNEGLSLFLCRLLCLLNHGILQVYGLFLRVLVGLQYPTYNHTRSHTPSCA